MMNTRDLKVGDEIYCFDSGSVSKFDYFDKYIEKLKIMAINPHEKNHDDDDYLFDMELDGFDWTINVKENEESFYETKKELIEAYIANCEKEIKFDEEQLKKAKKVLTYYKNDGEN